MTGLVDQIIQLAGAMLILAAFAGAQAGRLERCSHGYLLPNLLGSAALAGEAAHGRQWGFLLLEGAWAVISLAGIVTAVLAAHARPAAAA
jgi:hypothetical protein